jgi:hypothetical protein
VLLNYVPGDASQALLKTSYDNGTSDEYVVLLPPGSGTGVTFTFNAFVSQHQLTGLGVATVPQLDIILTPDGAIVIT